MRRLCLIVPLLVVLVCSPAGAADKDGERARKVKVALALAEAKAEPAKKDDHRAAKVAAALEAAGIPSPAPFVTVPTVAPAPMPREVSVAPCDCLTEGLDACKCGPSCKCREDAKGEAVKIVRRPTWHTDYNAALKLSAGKTMVVLFTDPKACVPCRKLEAGALADPAVRDQLAAYVCVKIDVTTDYGRSMLAFFAAHRDGVTVWPTLKVYKAGIRVADWHAVPGEDVTADVLLGLIR